MKNLKIRLCIYQMKDTKQSISFMCPQLVAKTKYIDTLIKLLFIYLFIYLFISSS